MNTYKLNLRGHEPREIQADYFTVHDETVSFYAQPGEKETSLNAFLFAFFTGVESVEKDRR